MCKKHNYTILYLVLLLLFLMPKLAVSVEPPNVTHLSSFSEGLYAPIRIAMDAEGKAYVTDTRKHRVCVLDAYGNLLKYIYGMQAPLGIAVDRQGKLYIGDKQTGSVAIFNRSLGDFGYGSSIGKLGSGVGQFTMPTDIAIDSQNKIYVVDSKENCVKVFDENGSYEFQFGDSILTFPTGIAVDETNDAILVGQYGALENSRNAAKVQIFDMKGNWKNSIGKYGSNAGEFTRIQGLAVDKQGRIYVTDCFQSTVQVVDYAGRGLSFIGNYKTESGQLRIPSDVAFDRYNRLWVTSSENGRIEVFGIDAYSSPDDRSSGDVQDGFTMDLVAGINFVSVPLKPPTEWKLSDLATYIGAEVILITTYVPEKERFLSYLPGFTAEDTLVNIPVKGSAAYIIVMREGKSVKFQGTAWEGKVTFASGLNMFAVPLQPNVEWRLSDLADHIGEELIHFVTYNQANKRFGVYFPGTDSPLNVSVKGGMGYFAIMSNSKTVMFEGEAWKNQALAAAAAATGDDSTSSLSNAPMLIVLGKALNSETGQILKDVSIEIKDLNTGVTKTSITNSDGGYVATFIDFVGNRAAIVGDTFQVKAADPYWISETITYTLTAEDIRMYHIILPPIQLEVMPKESVLLPSYPNPSNPETWIPFRLSQDTEVTIEIYNVAGQLIRTLTLGRKATGNYISRQRAAYWDGTNNLGETVTSGIYFYTIRAGAFETTRRMVILK